MASVTRENGSMNWINWMDNTPQSEAGTDEFQRMGDLGCACMNAGITNPEAIAGMVELLKDASKCEVHLIVERAQAILKQAGVE